MVAFISIMNLFGGYYLGIFIYIYGEHVATGKLT